MTSEARSTYKIRNWAKYNEALVNRGDVTFWFSDEILEQWKHENLEQGQGYPFVFSDLAIETLLTMRELFRLPYRNTEGFGRWVFKVMQLDLAIPDYTSLCKRAAKLGIQITIVQKKGKIDVVVDSTGLKVGTQKLEATDRLSPSFARGDRDVPNENLLRRSFEKPIASQSKNGIENQMQNPQPLHPTRTARVFF